jgi:hypothetical protein
MKKLPLGGRPPGLPPSGFTGEVVTIGRQPSSAAPYNPDKYFYLHNLISIIIFIHILKPESLQAV